MRRRTRQFLNVSRVDVESGSFAICRFVNDAFVATSLIESFVNVPRYLVLVESGQIETLGHIGALQNGSQSVSYAREIYHLLGREYQTYAFTVVSIEIEVE